MAPELAVAALSELRKDAVVLDPMCGSGTVLQESARRGFLTYGFDVDPLAVLLARVATSQVRGETVREAAKVVTAKAREGVGPPAWVPADAETLEFTRYWFGDPQATYLGSLASVLASRRGPAADALRVAFSRIIVTKDRGASLARDVSHSRPHKSFETSNYDVMAGFTSSVEAVAQWLDENTPPRRAYVQRGDARRLPSKLTGSVDLVVTSPPYLNAIDYIRGHRLALVWLGFHMSELRQIRSTSVGTERGLSTPAPEFEEIASGATAGGSLPTREHRMLLRYVSDMSDVVREVARVLRSDGRAVFVVGNSTLRGVFISNSTVVKETARRVGLVVQSERERVLPPQHRYLPPPTQSASSLDKRMKTESVITLGKA